MPVKIFCLHCDTWAFLFFFFSFAFLLVTVFLIGIKLTLICFLDTLQVSQGVIPSVHHMTFANTSMVLAIVDSPASPTRPPAAASSSRPRVSALRWPQEFIVGSMTLFSSNRMLALQPSPPLVARDNLENPVFLNRFWFKTPCL